MGYWSTLWQVQMRALLAVLVCAVIVAIYFGVDGALNAGYESAASGWAMMGFSGTIIFGFPIAAVYGVPIYVLMMRNSTVTWPRVVVIGGLPSVPIAIFGGEGGEFVLFALTCGVFVAAGTHVLMRLLPVTRRSG